MKVENNTTLSQDYLNFITQLIFGAIVVFIFLSQFERFLTMIFVLNFSTAGPNVTVVLIVLLLTGVVELILPWPHSVRTLSISLIGTLVMVLLGFIPITIVATVAAILAMMFITPMLIHRIQQEKEKFTMSVIMGVVIQIFTRSWLNTASYYATAIGSIIFLIWISMGVLFWFVTIRKDVNLINSSQITFTDATPVIGFILIQFIFLGFPNVVSTWFFRDYVIMFVASIVGLSIGAFLIFEKYEQILRNKLVLGWSVVFLLSLIDLLWINLLPALSYFAVQVSACVLLYTGLNKSTLRSHKVVGLRLIVVQLLIVFILLLNVSAGNWAFMPSILAFTRGHAATAIFLAGLIFTLTNLRFTIAVKSIGTPPNVLNSVRIILLFVVIISAAGVISNELFMNSKSPDSSKLKIMTFNIHQYFSIGQTGLYNLEQVRDVILESGADVVGLEESEGARISSSNMNGVRWLAHQTGMKHYYYGPPTSAQIYGVSLLSRFPIVNAYYENLPAEESIERVVIVVEIDTGDVMGKLPILVTHLQTHRYSIDRYNQVMKIINITQDFPNAVILGDFNTRPDITDDTYMLLNSTFSDAWLLAGNASDSGTSYSSSGVAKNRIDYIWLKGSWNVSISATFGSPRASDHRAVYAELVVG